jgi:pimeloyl-ACP methyl ester carboxylesterase
LAIGCAALVLVAGGCSTPVGANKVPLQQAYEELDRNVLNSGQLSALTEVVIHRYGMSETYRKNPASTLKRLHEIALTDERHDVLYALAELSYSLGEKQSRSHKLTTRFAGRDRFLASSIYAYLFMLSEEDGNVFDRHFRNACDIYNRALPQAFACSQQTNAGVILMSGERQLPFGQAQVTLRTNDFPWPVEDFKEFLPANQYSVRGVSVRNRQSGIGAPLIGVARVPVSHRYVRTVPATLFGRFQGGLKDFAEGRGTVSLELLSPYDKQTVRIEGKDVPLETDLTTAMAYALNNSHIWRLGSQQFFTYVEKVKSDVYPFQTFERGRIPVVFVHGTFSSPVWWTEMMNSLFSDPVLRQKYQFWFFVYNSGNPISLSANKLRDALRNVVDTLDPNGTDPALKQMVVIGHSQGGLLTKLTATDTEDALWKASFDEPLETLDLPEEKRERLRKAFYFEPLPFVDRVVFISTPHRGSYLATAFVRNLVRKLVKLPVEVVDVSATVLTLQVDKIPEKFTKPTSSLDDMSPRSPGLLALAELPVSGEVEAHSIVAVKGKAVPPEGGDGVVKYSSAHVPYAKSEFVVRSGHSCQGEPQVVEEVRRILMEHLAGAARQPGAGADAGATRSSESK